MSVGIQSTAKIFYSKSQSAKVLIWKISIRIEIIGNKNDVKINNTPTILSNLVKTIESSIERLEQIRKGTVFNQNEQNVSSLNRKIPKRDLKFTDVLVVDGTIGCTEKEHHIEPCQGIVDSNRRIWIIIAGIKNYGL